MLRDTSLCEAPQMRGEYSIYLMQKSLAGREDVIASEAIQTGMDCFVACSSQ